MSTRIKKYHIDQWVIYRRGGIGDKKRALILWCFNDNTSLYDYEIYIDETGERIKVLESSLFTELPPTY
jgi:hypothetical protein